MILSESNSRIFFDNYLPVLFYAGVYEGLIPQGTRLADFVDVALHTKASCRDALYMDRAILKYFLSDNKHLLDNRAVDFIRQVTKGLLAEFIVLEQKKDFAVLLEVSTNRFYEVINITEPFSEMLADLPVKIKTAIFNFNGKIVCDGLIVGGRVHIGPEMTKGFIYDYEIAKKNAEVIVLLK